MVNLLVDTKEMRVGKPSIPLVVEATRVTESTPTLNGITKDKNKLFARAVRGYAIIAKDKEPKHLDKASYRISSQNGNGKYIIAKNGSG